VLDDLRALYGTVLWVQDEKIPAGSRGDVKEDHVIIRIYTGDLRCRRKGEATSVRLAHANVWSHKITGGDPTFKIDLTHPDSIPTFFAHIHSSVMGHLCPLINDTKTILNEWRHVDFQGEDNIATVILPPSTYELTEATEFLDDTRRRLDLQFIGFMHLRGYDYPDLSKPIRLGDYTYKPGDLETYKANMKIKLRIGGDN